MNTRSLFLLVVLFGHNLLFAQSPKLLKAHLQKVTVYLRGAHLHYQESVTLGVGNNEFIFENISPEISVPSLQATSRGGMVMDVKHVVKYREKKIVTGKYDKEIAKIKDSLENIGFELRSIQNKMQVLATEKNMLLNNGLIKGSPRMDSLPLLRDGMSFLREKLNNIYDLELKWEMAKARADKRNVAFSNRYSELLRLQSGDESEEEVAEQPVNQVVVSVYSETAGTSVVNFNYYVEQASWVPLYDLQASSATNAFQLKYFANVVQQSGVDWKNVPLTLSTSNPDENNSKPMLSPWMVSFMEHMRRPQVKYKTKALTDVQSAAPKGELNEYYESKVSEADQVELEEVMVVNENLIRTEYELKLNYTVASDGLPHKVIINQREIPMQLQFAAVPKLCADAFLMANITGWEELNVIPGAARLYFDGAYVGEMYLNAGSTSDTISVNLGRDKTIAITRKKIKDKSKVRFMETDKVETRTIEITVRNTKNIPIEIVLEDQIPVAQGTDEIKVTLNAGSGATLDETTGELKWKLKLGSKDTKKILFTYEVRYPKTKAVAGL